MNYRNLLFSAVQFFLVLVVFCAGLFFVALPWAPKVSYKCAAFLTDRADVFIPLGGILLALGVVLGVGFYFLQKKPYFQVKMKPPVEVEVDVIHGILEAYWKTLFPGQNLKTEAIVHFDQKIEFVAELPSLSDPKTEKLLKEIEHDIGRLLVRNLGYKREFIFTFLTTSYT
jgi:hypothetical protein